MIDIVFVLNILFRICGILVLLALTYFIIKISKIFSIIKDSLEINRTEINQAIKDIPKITNNIDTITKETGEILTGIKPMVVDITDNVSNITENISSISESADNLADKVSESVINTIDFTAGIFSSIGNFASGMNSNYKKKKNTTVETISNLIDSVKNFTK